MKSITITEFLTDYKNILPVKGEGFMLTISGEVQAIVVPKSRLKITHELRELKFAVPKKVVPQRGTGIMGTWQERVG